MKKEPKKTIQAFPNKCGISFKQPISNSFVKLVTFLYIARVNTRRPYLFALIIVAIFVVSAIVLTLTVPDKLRHWIEGVHITWNSERTTYGEKINSKVKRVVDGDTIVLENNDTVRLLNIDTPETVKKNTPVMCYGKEASEFNKKLEANKNIVLRFDREQRDRYGRLLAFIFEEGADSSIIDNSYNAQLVKLGYARSYFVAPNTTYEKFFRKLEREARDAKIGVWGACPKPFVE